MVFTGLGLFINYLGAREDRRIAQERLVTERFSKAITQLGNSQEEVIIGGIYSLERIAKDSPKYQWTIMEVLTAFVRQNSHIPRETQEYHFVLGKNLEELEELKSVETQVQAALTVIGRRDSNQDYISSESPESNNKKLDLSHSNLRDSDLNHAYLSHANLSYSNLRDADLEHTNLEHANLQSANLTNADPRYASLYSADLLNAVLIDTSLSYADLRGATISGADLRGAFLIDTNLEGANFFLANLSDANLEGANLEGAKLSDANLEGANLEGAKYLSNQQIKSACLWEKAIYTDAEWNSTEKKWISKDEKSNQAKIEAIKQDKTSDHIISPRCDRWK